MLYLKKKLKTREIKLTRDTMREGIEGGRFKGGSSIVAIH
jgi:hypothetical protein